MENETNIPVKSSPLALQRRLNGKGVVDTSFLDNSLQTIYGATRSSTASRTSDDCSLHNEFDANDWKDKTDDL